MCTKVSRALLVLIFALFATACGAPFEEGTVTATRWEDPPPYEDCSPQYILIPDGQGGLRNQYIGEDCDWRDPPGYWVVTLSGYTDEGEGATHDLRLHHPYDRPPVNEGDVYNLAENRVVQRN